MVAHGEPVSPKGSVGTLALHEAIESGKGSGTLAEPRKAIRVKLMGELQWREHWVVRVAIVGSLKVFRGLLDRGEEFQEPVPAHDVQQRAIEREAYCKEKEG